MIHTAFGPVAPVPVELAAQSVDGVARAAAVAIGPAGRQVLGVVIEATSPRRSGIAVPRRGSMRLAEADLAERVRNAVRALLANPDDSPALGDVAMVLEIAKMPVDRRHHSKIDRAALSAAASQLAEGR